MKKLALFVLLAAGCGGGYVTPVPPVTQNASVIGQYNIALTSTTGQEIITVFTNFSQSGKSIAGSPNTLVCPANDLSKCIGGAAAPADIIVTGTVDATNVTMTISFPADSGTRTITMTGAVSGPASGTYTDNLGDSGTWTASSEYTFNAQYTGSYNSTTHPLSIAPSVVFALKQDDNFAVTGNATITHSPCISSLTLSGEAIGGAFILNDTPSKVQIFATPSTPQSFLTLNFSYSFASDAPNCAGDVGTGTISTTDPFAY